MWAVVGVVESRGDGRGEMRKGPRSTGQDLEAAGGSLEMEGGGLVPRGRAPRGVSLPPFSTRSLPPRRTTSRPPSGSSRRTESRPRLESTYTPGGPR